MPPPTGGSAFTGPSADGSVSDHSGTGGGNSTGTAPGWFRDPFFRHEQRYWSGGAWTEHVTDSGAPGIDPPPDTSSR